VTNVVLFAALGSAVLHGIWNAIAKAIPNGLISSALISLSYLIIGGALCLALPIRPPEVWTYLVISALLQTVYLLLLTTAYSKMEFGMAYPITRGIAVLGVTVISVVWLGEKLAFCLVLASQSWCFPCLRFRGRLESLPACHVLTCHSSWWPVSVPP
jgi:multidrug transporter EmrE-like cation transporter